MERTLFLRIHQASYSLAIVEEQNGEVMPLILMVFYIKMPIMIYGCFK